MFNSYKNLSRGTSVSCKKRKKKKSKKAFKDRVKLESDYFRKQMKKLSEFREKLAHPLGLPKKTPRKQTEDAYYVRPSSKKTKKRRY